MAAAAFTLCIAAAQNSFEIASVKVSDPYKDPMVAWLTYPGGRIVVTNYTLTMLVEEAYGVSMYRIAGGPAWIRDELYTITAKAPARSAAAEFVPSKPNIPPTTDTRAMMRSLLGDRFGLRVHREVRQAAVFGLFVDKGRTKLTPTRNSSAEPSWYVKGSEWEVHNRDMAWLSSILERQLGRTVLDRTGLTATYDFHLRFDPRSTGAASIGTVPLDGLPPLDTALETQLGLKLKQIKGPVEILVIDEARRPGEN